MVAGKVVAQTNQTGTMIAKGMTRPSGLFLLAIILIPLGWILGFFGLKELSAFLIFGAFFLFGLIPLVYPQVPPSKPNLKVNFFLFMLILGIIFGMMFRYTPEFVGIGG